MPAFETSTGSRREINLPTTEWPELQKVIEAYEDLRRERKVTQARAVTLTQERHTAEAQATQALAKAIREGKGEEAVAAKVEKEAARIDKEAAACERRLLAIEEALDSAEFDLIDVVENNRATWLEEIEAEVDSAYVEYRSAVAVLAGKRLVLSRVHALRSWLRGFPDEVESYKVGQGVLPKLRGQNGSPYAVQQVLDALTEDANPSAPEPLAPFQPLLPRLTSGVVEGGVHVPTSQ